MDKIKIREHIEKVKCFLLDLDGTLYLGGNPIEGAAETVNKIGNTGRRVIYLTNNSSVTKRDYQKKLKKMGFAADKNEIFTSIDATLFWLQRNYVNNIHVLGTDKVKNIFKGNGLVTEDASPKMVVVAYDTELTYQKLDTACAYIRNGVPYILTHGDINCPATGGFRPDAGSFLALIKASTGVSPVAVCGKPESIMAQGLQRIAMMEPKSTAMVGDRLYTDIVFAKRNNYLSVLVLSGEAKKKDLDSSQFQPDIVFGSISELAEYL